MIDRREMEAILEAILFVSSEPVPRQKLVDLFDEEDRPHVPEALATVLARYGGGAGRVSVAPSPPEAGADTVAGAEREAGEAVEPGQSGEVGEAGESVDPMEGRGILVEDVAGGVRLATRPEMAGWLRRFFDVSGGSKLSMAALETMAIIAYRQPVTAPEIQELRGVSASGVLKTLLERRLVRITGRKEVVGKPFLYGTTKEFLVHFGLNTLKDLPPLEEFEETFGATAGGGGDAITPVSAETMEAFLPQPIDESLLVDREESFQREVAALEEAADSGEPD